MFVWYVEMEPGVPTTGRPGHWNHILYKETRMSDSQLSAINHPSGVDLNPTALGVKTVQRLRNHDTWMLTGNIKTTDQQKSPGTFRNAA